MRGGGVIRPRQPRRGKTIDAFGGRTVLFSRMRSGFLRIILWQGVGFSDYGPHFLSVAATVCFSLVGVVCFGTLAGSMLPFLLHALRFDPATSSAPFVATLVDVTGLIIYFQVAALILRGALV